MTISVDHILLPARARDVSARFLAEVLGRSVSGDSAGAPPGRFAVVPVDGTSLDYETMNEVPPMHVAFLVSDDEFDGVLSRLKERSIAYSADPMHERCGELNDNGGGRGLYFRDPDGHNFELLTRSKPTRVI